jgi:Raf kinase inhibitor-like YbhB/YbcL family protein
VKDNTMIRKFTILLVILLFQLACGGAPPSAGGKEVNGTMRFAIGSASFLEGQEIPVQHTCDGPDISPALQWGRPPEGAKSFALICDDPDAPVGTWVHWVIYNIPATALGLPENVPKVKDLADGSRQGTNDFRRIGYGGPCPPPGPDHRYFFKLYALSKVLNLPAGATKAELLRAMEGSVLATAQLMGRYGRKL